MGLSLCECVHVLGLITAFMPGPALTSWSLVQDAGAGTGPNKSREAAEESLPRPAEMPLGE